METAGHWFKATLLWGALAAAIVSLQAGEPPARFKATALSGTEMALSWEAPAGVSGYQLERRDVERDTWQTLAAPAAGDVAFTDSGLPAGKQFEYRLTAQFADASEESADAPVTPTHSDGVVLFTARDSFVPSSGRTMVLDAWGVRRFGATAIDALPSPLGPGFPGGLWADLPGGIWFPATSAAGTEPWLFDGETARQIADIAPGPDSSAPTGFLPFGDGVMFTARTKEFGEELYEYSGGVVRLAADIEPGPASSRLSRGITVGDFFYFFADTVATGSEPWVWDGEEARMLVELVPGPNDAIVSRFHNVFEGGLYFVAYGAGDRQLWLIEDGAVRVVAVLAEDDTRATAGVLGVHAGALYLTITRDSPKKCWQLWRIATKGAPLELVVEEEIEASFSIPSRITAGGRLYFVVTTTAHGSENWVIDANGSAAVLDSIRPGAEGADTSRRIAAGDQLYFRASAVEGESAIWHHDGQGDAELVPGTSGLVPQFAFGEDLIATDASGSVLWLIDSASDTATQFADLGTEFGTIRHSTELPDGYYITTVLGNGSNAVCAWFIGFNGQASRLPIVFGDPGDSGRQSDQAMIRIGDLGYIVAAPAGDFELRTLYEFDGATLSPVEFESVPHEGLYPHSGFSGKSAPVAFSGELVFAGAREGVGEELWRYMDGAAGPELIADLWPVSSSPGEMAVVNGKLYFSACDEDHGRELWEWDGVAEPQRLTDLAPGPASSDPRYIRTFGGAVHFVAGDGSGSGEMLWKLAAGGAIELVSDAGSAVGAEHSGAYTSVGGEHFFFLLEPTGFSLWRVDAAGDVDEIPLPQGLDVRFNTLLFNDGTSMLINSVTKTMIFNGTTFADFATGRIGRVFEWDGATHAHFTSSGAVVRLENGASSGVFSAPFSAGDFAPAGDVLFFDVWDSLAGMAQIWNYQVGDVVPTRCDPAPGAPVWTSPIGLAAVGADLYFTALSGGERELWAKPANGGVGLILDHYPGSHPIERAPPEGGEVYPHGKRVYFSREGGFGSGGNPGLWSTSGIVDSPVRSIHHFAGQLLYSLTNSGSEDQHEWHSISAATGEVTELPEPDFGVWSEEVVEWQGRGYFNANDSTHGWEYWCYDDAVATILYDITPGQGSGAASLPIAGDERLYFVAAHPDHGDEIWSWNGLAEIPSLLFETAPGTASAVPVLIGVLGDTLYFTAATSPLGRELSRYNVATGVTPLEEIIDGSDGGLDRTRSRSGVAYDGAFYFAAENGQSGLELWRHQAGETAAEMVADLNPGMADASPRDLMVFNGRLYFTAETKSVGRELWAYNGTEVELAADIAGPVFSTRDFGALSSNPGEFKNATLGNTPTALHISVAAVAENLPVGSVVGLLSADDADGELDAHVFQFIPGVGDDSNALFAIVDGDQLVTTATFDYEAGDTNFTIRVRATDREGLAIEQVFAVEVEDEPPFREWIAGFFPGALGDASVTGPNADPNANGLGNLIEYIFGTDPTAVGSVPVIEITAEADGALVLRFELPESVPAGATLTVESSATLDGTPWETIAVQDAAGDWMSDEGVDVTVTPLGNGRATVEVRLDRSTGAMFVRLRGSLEP